MKRSDNMFFDSKKAGFNNSGNKKHKAQRA